MHSVRPTGSHAAEPATSVLDDALRGLGDGLVAGLAGGLGDGLASGIAGGEDSLFDLGHELIALGAHQETAVDGVTEHSVFDDDCLADDGAGASNGGLQRSFDLQENGTDLTELLHLTKVDGLGGYCLNAWL
jgi:hypothetical protein